MSTNHILGYHKSCLACSKVATSVSRDFCGARPDLAPLIDDDEPIRAKPKLLHIPAFKCAHFSCLDKAYIGLFELMFSFKQSRDFCEAPLLYVASTDCNRPTRAKSKLLQIPAFKCARFSCVDKTYIVLLECMFSFQKGRDFFKTRLAYAASTSVDTPIVPEFKFLRIPTFKIARFLCEHNTYVGQLDYMFRFK